MLGYDKLCFKGAAGKAYGIKELLVLLPMFFTLSDENNFRVGALGLFICLGDHKFFSETRVQNNGIRSKKECIRLFTIELHMKWGVYEETF